MYRLCAIVLLTASFGSTAAKAYVLPGDYLIRTLAEKRREMKIQDLSIQLNTERTGIEEPIDERLYLKQPERMRLVQQGGEELIYVEREGKCARGTAERLVPIRGPLTDLLATLLMAGGEDIDARSHRMMTRLRALGIDVSVVHLGRNDNRVVYIIGAKSWEENKPQLWLDKTTFLPVRIVTLAGTHAATPGVREVRLLDWGSAVGGNWFPGVLEEYVNGELVRRAEVTQLQTNQALPETMFELPR